LSILVGGAPGEIERARPVLEAMGTTLHHCGGIGAGAYNALAAHGITPVVAAGRHPAEEAVALYLAGKLATTDERVCLCGPGHHD
ncbi:MAG: hypothetical protein M1436_07055, partial [Acidobacteria bacterium]|nr:hypothetical protein [Acidobacteriota bacterium]